MNSLPLISHHLFVAAVGNDARATDRRRRRDSMAVDPGQDPASGLEMMAGAQPMPQDAIRPLRPTPRSARS